MNKIIIVLIFMHISLALFSINSQPWGREYIQPVNAETYPASTNGTLFNIYPIFMFDDYVNRGDSIIFKFLLPPGTERANISAQSNSWQCAGEILDDDGNIITQRYERCPVMDAFEDYPNDLCPSWQLAETKPCGEGEYTYLGDLHTVTARLLDILYPTNSDTIVPLKEAKYSYFVLYQQPDALGVFTFTSSLGMSVAITDRELYNCWRNKRSWAGGDGDEFGIGETCVVFVCNENETRECYSGNDSNKNIGVCKSGLETCLNNAWSVCENEVLPETEICEDNLDNNCDGETDENCNTETIECNENEEKICYTGSLDKVNIGICKSGIQQCINGKWNTCDGEVLAKAEICDNLDNNCNGEVDENLENCNTEKEDNNINNSSSNCSFHSSNNSNSLFLLFMLILMARIVFRKKIF